ncbi:MAG: ABC transporter permease [Pseudomonadota bacterium]
MTEKPGGVTKVPGPAIPQAVPQSPAKPGDVSLVQAVGEEETSTIRSEERPIRSKLGAQSALLSLLSRFVEFGRNSELLRTLGFPGASGQNSIVPARSVASQTLVIVVAIMSFLACLTFAGVSIVWEQATIWKAEISSEVTIQVRPVAGADLNEELEKARQFAENTPGIANVVLLDADWSEELLAPWLGEDFDLSTLPVPRILILELDRNRPANLAALSERITSNVQGASFDDHSLWLERLSRMANAVVLVGIVLMILMLTAMVLSVTFATNGAMAGNRDVLEVLHFVGGSDAFIANEFQRRFLVLGLQGGFGGGILAMLAMALLNLWSRFSAATPQGDQLRALFGRFEIGMTGYLGALFLIIVVAGLTAVTSRIAVLRYLTRMS